MSNIDFISIDETFPLAGRDNDSQGFRDNFSVIKNNFEAAKGEIEDLQFNAVRVDQANNFNGENIVNANFVACSEELFEGRGVGENTTVDWNNGSYQTFTATGDLQFTLLGFPDSGRVGKITLQIDAEGVNRQINFGISTGGSFKKSPNVPTLPLTISPSGEYHIFEFWTYNFSASSSERIVFMDYIGKFE